MVFVRKLQPSSGHVYHVFELRAPRGRLGGGGAADAADAAAAADAADAAAAAAAGGGGGPVCDYDGDVVWYAAGSMLPAVQVRHLLWLDWAGSRAASSSR